MLLNALSKLNELRHFPAYQLERRVNVKQVLLIEHVTIPNEMPESAPASSVPPFCPPESTRAGY